MAGADQEGVFEFLARSAGKDAGGCGGRLFYVTDVALSMSSGISHFHPLRALSTFNMPDLRLVCSHTQTSARRPGAYAGFESIPSAFLERSPSCLAISML